MPGHRYQLLAGHCAPFWRIWQALSPPPWKLAGQTADCSGRLRTEDARGRVGGSDCSSRLYCRPGRCVRARCCCCCCCCCCQLASSAYSDRRLIRDTTLTVAVNSSRTTSLAPICREALTTTVGALGLFLDNVTRASYHRSADYRSSSEIQRLPTPPDTTSRRYDVVRRAAVCRCWIFLHGSCGLPETAERRVGCRPALRFSLVLAAT